MKTILSLAFAATVSATVIFCTKNQLSENNFVTTVNNVDATCTGRTISIATHLAGQVAVSDDVLPGAFSVQ